MKTMKELTEMFESDIEVAREAFRSGGVEVKVSLFSQLLNAYSLLLYRPESLTKEVDLNAKN